MKPTLLLLHGALGASSQMQGLKELLEDEFEIFTPEFPGHGKTVPSGEFTINFFSEFLNDFLEEKNLTHANVFGYSMGGYVALKCAANYPGKIKRIVTLGTKFDWNPQTAEKETRQLNPVKMQEKIPAFVEFLRRLHPDNLWETVVQNTASLMLDLGNSGGLKNNELEAIKIPVCIGLGEDDKMVSREESENICRQLENGKFKLLENSEHAFDKVHPMQLSQFILHHIK